MSVFIIAEAGTAHQGDFSVARQMIKVAAEAHADAVKFQMFKDTSFLNPDEQEMAERLMKWRFSTDDWRRLASQCESCGIEFMASAFDRESVDYLVELGVKRFKVASRTLRDDPRLIEYILTKNLPTYISTGFLDTSPILTRQDGYFTRFIGMKEPPIIILHCVSKYPALPEEANLHKINSLRSPHLALYSLGYSDHTVGFTAPIVAVALGATVIEKHFRLNSGDPKHPDYACSLSPDELMEMVARIREAELMLQ